MKIKKYNIFLEKDNLRSDEHSHLNDILGKFEKSKFEGRWDADDYDDDDDDDDYGFYDKDDEDDISSNYSPKKDSTFRDEEYDEEYGEDGINSNDIQHLNYLLRSMFKNSGIEDVQIENKKLDISISCVLRKRESMKNVIKVFEIAKKLKRDILAQYDSEFEMWETKDGRPLLTFNFYYGEGLNNDYAPF
jgi:hypothetical protein